MVFYKYFICIWYNTAETNRIIRILNTKHVVSIRKRLQKQKLRFNRYPTCEEMILSTPRVSSSSWHLMLLHNPKYPSTQKVPSAERDFTEFEKHVDLFECLCLLAYVTIPHRHPIHNCLPSPSIATCLRDCFVSIDESSAAIQTFWIWVIDVGYKGLKKFMFSLDWDSND